MLWGNQSKLQKKMFTLLALGILVPVSAVSLYSISSSSQALVDGASRQMQFQGKTSAELMNVILQNIRADILYLSQTPPIQGIVRSRENNGIDPLDQSTYASWMKRLDIIFTSFLGARSFYDQVRYIDENGNELLRVDTRNGQVYTVAASKLENQSKSQYFVETMKLAAGQVYVSPINLSRERGAIAIPHNPVIRYATPIFNQKGQRKGILIANISIPAVFSEMEKGFSESRWSQKFMVINQQGYYLHHADNQKEMGFDLNRPDAILQKDYPAEVSRQVLRGKSGFIQQGSEHFFSYETIFPNADTKEHPFILLYQTPQAAVLAPVEQFKLVALVVGLVSLSASLALGTQLLRQVVHSIGSLMSSMSGFSTQMLSTVDEQERSATQQATAVQQTTTTMNELSASSRQSSEQAEAAAVGACQVLNLVVGDDRDQDRQSDSLKTKVNQIAEQILHLSETTNQIGSISSLVSELANQTNMLALNAAVEAVRAGEHGKGFSVVAAEIRKLAEQSRKSAEKINGLVNEIQRATNSTVMVTDEGTKTVERIVAAIGNITSNSQQISLTAKQQAIAISQVVDAMTSINHEAAQVAASIVQTKASTQQLSEAAKTLLTVI